MVVVPRVAAAVVPAVVAGAVSVTPSTRCCTAAAEVVSVTEVGSPTGVLLLPWEEKYTISPRAMMDRQITENRVRRFLLSFLSFFDVAIKITPRQ